MSADDEQSLTAEELRKRLYVSFKRKGVLDAVKTQLRNQLIVELQRESLVLPPPEHGDSLWLLASNSLVMDHLQSLGYEYTLSVFHPECAISKEQVLSKKDILGLLRISPHSPVYEQLMAVIHREQKGLLITLLSELVDHRLQSRVRDADTQTTHTLDHRESMVKKMQVIDEEYEVLRRKGESWASLEGKLAEYRKEMEEQAQAQLKSTIQHFQEVEISRVRMEEREKCQQEVSEVRRQLERNHEVKSEALMSREKNAIERLQKQQQMEEKEIYTQRQALLKEIESVRTREAELRLRTEVFENSCKLHEEKMSSSEDLLRRRELDVRKMEETYNQKLGSEIRRHQLELKEDYARRTAAMTESENRNREETARIQREAATIDSRREEYRRAERELARAQEELALAHGNMCVLVQQNAALKEQLEGASDYAAVRNQRTELQAEVHLLRGKLEESQEEKQRLCQELNTPSPELLTLQAELKRLESARRLEQEDFQNQKQIFHAQLTQEVERCAQLKVQLLECEERTRWMTTHTEELTQQLRHTQQALENEVLRNPKPSLVDCSVPEPNPAGLFPTDVYNEGCHDNLCDPGLSTRRRCRSQSEGEEMVAAALNRIRELEKEAETLEEAYRSYRRKGVVSHIPLKGASPPPLRGSPPFARSIGAVKSRERPEDAYTVTEPSQRAPGHMTSHTADSPPIRHLFSTPVSASKTKPRTHAKQGSQQEVSPIPVVSLEEYTHITPPSSPQLKSTTRDHYSPPKLQSISSSSQESSPQPERISIQDLTESQTGVSYSSEQQMGEAHTHVEQHDGVQSVAGKKCEEDEEERRQQEEEEAQERERTELERLQQDQEDHHEEQWAEGGAEEEAENRSGGETENRDERTGVMMMEKADDGETEEAQEDPLRKYMLMVMQEREREQGMKKDESENQSPESVVLSDLKDDSITAFSHHDADYDDFW